MLDFFEEMKARHSVRNYTDQPLTQSQIDELNAFIDTINKNTGLRFSLKVNEDIFSHWILGYGFIKNCSNHIRLAGTPSPDLEEEVGYYGEMLVLKAQQLGLNTCWVGGTYRKKDVKDDPSIRLVCVLALGNGKTQGTPSKSKPMNAYYQGENVPDWFIQGMEAVLLSPSAVNQKKWMFVYHQDGTVSASSNGKHFNDVDLGIAKLHFELGSHRKIWSYPYDFILG